jgi:PTS system nitrogen regulatory IIA component
MVRRREGPGPGSTSARSWHRSCVGVEALQLRVILAASPPLVSIFLTPLAEAISQPDGQIHLGTLMTITDLVAPEAILPALKVNSKKQALQELAARAAVLTGQNERAVFEVLLQREKLGTTAVGYGVAIPHGKLPKLEKLFGLFARLERPIDFEAMDGQPVDLVFLLLAPEGAGADHLKALARIARLLRDQDVAKKLRASRDAQAIYSVLALPPASAA